MGDLIPFPRKVPDPAPAGCIRPVVGAIAGVQAVRLIQGSCPVHGPNATSTGAVTDVDGNQIWRWPA